MRILIINSEYPPLGGGTGNTSANLARHLAERGQDVALMTANFPGLPQEEHQNGVFIRRIPALKNIRIALAQLNNSALFLVERFMPYHSCAPGNRMPSLFFLASRMERSHG